MILTRENYHSTAANIHYLSVSQFNSFLSCEAATIAELSGEWAPEKPAAFLVGSFVHAAIEGRDALNDFISKSHPADIYTKQGKLRSEFEQANEMITTLQKDPFAMMLLTGQKEVIMTAELFGVPWKIRMDVYVPGKRIVDLKTTKSIQELQWSVEHGGRVSFIEQYEYFRQVAVYSEVERLNVGSENWLDFYMVAVSKEKVPDKEVIELTDHDRLQVELAKIGAHMPRIVAVKSGRVEPFRCGRCDYCLSTKRLTRAIHYSEIGA